jgi:hypothetical protein
MGWMHGVSLYISGHQACLPAFLSRPLRGHPLPGRGDFTAATAAESVKNSYKNSRKVLTNEIKNGKLIIVSEG